MHFHCAHLRHNEVGNRNRKKVERQYALMGSVTDHAVMRFSYELSWLFAVSLWLNHLSSLWLRFSICKLDIMLKHHTGLKTYFIVQCLQSVLISKMGFSFKSFSIGLVLLPLKSVVVLNAY